MFVRFLFVGGSGFLIDTAITYALIKLGLPAIFARIPAILLTMLFTWLCNRHFTYKVKSPNSTREALRYAAVAVAMASTNYAIYFILLAHGFNAVMAIASAVACQAVIGFRLYRHFVFNNP